MKALDYKETESINGGGFISSACNAFGLAAGVYGAGVIASIWNPVGATATIVGGVIGLGCAGYAFATQ